MSRPNHGQAAPSAGPLASKPASAAPADGRSYRIWVLSNLQVDVEPFELPRPLPEFDALVVAGGVASGLGRAVRWLAEALDGRQGDRPVALVPGVHEFSDAVPVPQALDEASSLGRRLGIAVLHDDAVRLGAGDEPGLHIAGATLWPGFELAGPDKVVQARGHARHRWRALRRIRSAPGTPFQPHDAAGAHGRSRAFLADALACVAVGGNGFGAPDGTAVLKGVRAGDRAVVATAFPPSRACLTREAAEPLRDHWAAAWQGSALDEMFERWSAPPAWIFGGGTCAWDMRLGRTRLVANPRSPPTAGFDPGRVVVV